MKNLILLAFLCFSTLGFTQNTFISLSDEASINLITIGPGAVLNDAFGHNAIHVRDYKKGLDIVFNYGKFNFKTPNFYLKFARGKLLYEVGVDKYEDFEYSYKLQQRWIESQELELTQGQKQDVFEFLVNNAKEENKYYKYDFFYDNCSTRPFEIIKNEANVTMSYDHQEAGMTHRDLIHEYVSWNTWGSMGIDIALGSVIDRTATPEEYLFLPHELMYAFQEATINTPSGTLPLVKEAKTVFSPQVKHSYSANFLLSPLFILGLLAGFIIYKTYKDHKNENPLGWLDTSILLITGLVGVVVFLLWFGTDHNATAWNYNLLWAFPFHILAAFAVKRVQPPQWVYPYMKLAVIMMSLLFFHWIIGVQRFALSLLPLLLAIMIRYVFMLRRIKVTRTNGNEE